MFTSETRRPIQYVAVNAIILLANRILGGTTGVCQPDTVHGGSFVYLVKSPQEVFVIERGARKEADQSDLSLPRPLLGERGEGPLAVRRECLDTADAVDRQVVFFCFFKS